MSSLMTWKAIRLVYDIQSPSVRYIQKNVQRSDQKRQSPKNEIKEEDGANIRMPRKP
jgi:hypothetical protein